MYGIGNSPREFNSNICLNNDLQACTLHECAVFTGICVCQSRNNLPQEGGREREREREMRIFVVVMTYHEDKKMKTNCINECHKTGYFVGENEPPLQ